MIMVIGTERRELAAWARTRAVSYMIYAANSTDPVSLEMFWKLPIDEREQKGDALSPEDTRKAMLALANKYSKINQN